MSARGDACLSFTAGFIVAAMIYIYGFIQEWW
jgi:hypothetical protein